MREEKFHIYLNDDEYSRLIQSLIRLKNSLTAQGRPCNSEMPCGFHQSRRNRYPLHGTDLRQAHISVRRRKRKVVCRSKILMVGGFVT